MSIQKSAINNNDNIIITIVNSKTYYLASLSVYIIEITHPSFRINIIIVKMFTKVNSKFIY